MRILLDAGADTDCVDQAGLVPLQYAIERLLLDPICILGEANCSFRHPWLSLSETSHGEMVKCKLIDYFPKDHQWRFLGWLGYRSENYQNESDSLGESPMLVLDTLLDFIVSRRKRLCDLARQTIPPSEIAYWLPCSGGESHVIDETASRLVSELEHRGIYVPPHLHPGRDRITGYHYFAGYPKIAENLWKLGFRDVNGKDSFGRTPLMVNQLKFPSEWRQYVNSSRSFANWLEFVTWILGKGADLYARQDKTFIEGQCGTELLGVSAISFLAWIMSMGIAFHQLVPNFPFHGRIRPEMGLAHPPDEETFTESTLQTLRRIVMDCTTDDCTCSCSVSGCTMRTIIGKSYIDHGWSKNPWGYTNHYREVILYLAQLTNVDASLGSSEVLRFLTFRELDLKHTCCYWKFMNGVFMVMRISDQAEIDEFREEDSEGLSKLEELLTEFEMKMNELDIPFPDFLLDYWEPRMKEVHYGGKFSNITTSRVITLTSIQASRYGIRRSIDLFY